MRCMVLALLCALVSEAGADDKANLAAARKAFEVALTGGLEDAPATTTDHVGVFPGHLLDGDITRWRMGPPYITAPKIRATAAGWKGTWGWLATDLAVSQRPYTPSDGAIAKSKPHRYHTLQIYVVEGKGVAAKATMFADAQSDDKLPAVTPVPGGPPKRGTLAYYLVTPHESKLAADPQVVVMGSSEGEVAIGPVAATKLLASWRKLDLGMSGVSKELVAGDLGIVISEVQLRIGKKLVRLRGMIVGRKVGVGWEIVALCYGADSTSGDPKIP